MPKPKTISSDTLLKMQLENEEFRKEFDALEEEFEIARQIIRLRQKAKLTQKQLAKMAGTSQPTIARLESGEYKNLSLSFLRRIGKALGVIPHVQFKSLPGHTQKV
jgi:DNA-binding XRE family transcriptional regulator